MQLVFSGHHVSPPPVRYVGEHLDRPTYGDSDGCFLHHGSYYQEQDVLTVAFSPEILVVRGLDPVAESAVLTHEEEHYRDFEHQADRMRQAIQRAIAQGRELEIDVRWDWFTYDLREAANRYHQRTGQGDIIPNTEPGVPRPI